MAPSRACLSLWVCLALPFSLNGQNQRTNGQSKPALDAHGDPLPAFARARFGTVRFRHDNTVGIVRFAPDGETILAIDHEGSALRPA